MPSAKKKSHKHFLAMWDMNGLECLIDITKHNKKVEDIEKQKMWQILKEEPQCNVQPPRIPIQQMILRAKFNMQRSYEIYEFMSSESEEFIKEWFETEPQPLVDWIRKNGYKVYSDYKATKKCRIT